MSYIKKLKICTLCEKEYYGNPISKYCGYICSHKARESKKEIICTQCGESLIVQSYSKSLYCSIKCKSLHQTTLSVEIECTNCNNLFKRKVGKVKERNFCCKKCADIFNSGENHYEWKEINHLVLRKDALRRWGKNVKERDNYLCQDCGEGNSSILEAHHIECKAQNTEIELDVDNGVTLCIFCHYEKHRDEPKAARLINHKIQKFKEGLLLQKTKPGY